MHDQAFTIRDMCRSQRPREKLRAYGAQRLSTTELLALVLRTGRQGESALGLAARVCRVCQEGPPEQLTLEHLSRLPGIGLSKACSLLACIELGSRFFGGKKTLVSQLLSPRDVFDALQDIRGSKKEHFVALFLDTRNQQIEREVVSVGTLNASLVHPREVFEPAVRHLAAQVILAHNHPSGDLEPSDEDLAVNRRLVQAGQIIGIEVVDHIIVTHEAFLSFKEKGYC